MKKFTLLEIFVIFLIGLSTSVGVTFVAAIILAADSDSGLENVLTHPICIIIVVVSFLVSLAGITFLENRTLKILDKAWEGWR